jgi:hypothetical protein
MSMHRVLALLATLTLMSLLLAAPAGAAVGTKGYQVGSRSPLTGAQVRALKNAGATVKYVYKNFGGAAVTIPSTKVAAVKALRFVTGVYVDRLRQLDSVEVESAPSGAASPSAALPGTPYWLDLIDANEDTTTDGTGVWVAVLDSGMFPNWRKFLKPESILTQYARSFEGASQVIHQNWDSGSDPHGMAVAATIVGYWFHDGPKEGGWGTGTLAGGGTFWHPGVAEGAKIIPIQVCIPVGCFGSSINKAVDYITSLKKANPSQPIIINESLGGAGFDPLEHASLKAAISAGVVVVASAGNSGDAGMGFPGAYEPVISTGMGGWEDQWTSHPSKSWYLADVPDGADDAGDVGEVFVVDSSSRQLANQYLDVVSSGRFMLLPYP